MKRIRLILNKLFFTIIALLCFFNGCSSADSITYKYVAFEYVDSTEYAIQDYRGAVSAVQIPAEHKGCPVTVILDSVFYGYNMKELRMESIVDIYQRAFENCTYLSEVELGVVEEIGVQAFCGCSSLKRITIPETVVSIGHEAFWWCSNLEAVYFEGSPEYIGNNVFEADVIIYGPAGSLVEEYAKNNGLQFRSWEPDSN